MYAVHLSNIYVISMALLYRMFSHKLTLSYLRDEKVACGKMCFLIWPTFSQNTCVRFFSLKAFSNVTQNIV